MRELSTRMIEAVLDGEGLQGVAELAAAEAGSPVAIVLPPRGLAARAPGGGELNGLAEYAKARVAETQAATPDLIELERSIEAGGRTVGVVLLLASESTTAGRRCWSIATRCSELPHWRRWLRSLLPMRATRLSGRCGAG